MLKVGCEFRTDDVSDAVGVAFITHHLATDHPPPATPQGSHHQDVMEDECNVFEREWKVAANIPDANPSVYDLPH